MAYYLVFARPRATLVNDLEAQLAKDAFLGLQPFGRVLTASLKDARRLPDGTAVWEEEDYCRPPLAQERAAVLDHYFEDLSLERGHAAKAGSGLAICRRFSPLLARPARSDLQRDHAS